MNKKLKIFDSELPTDIRREIDNMVSRHGIDGVLNHLADNISIPADMEQQMHKNPNAYEFWGDTAARLVKTPKTFFVPMTFDAFKATGMMPDFKLKSDANKCGINQAVFVSAVIARWSMENNLDKIFLKNSTFSSKHRWPFTCNVDFKQSGKMSASERTEKVFGHIVNINSDAMLVWSDVALGMVAREMLPTKPMFYAFGQMFYQFKNKQTDKEFTIATAPSDDAYKNVEKWMKQNPDMTLHSTYHIGMPITRELRIFTFDGRVAAFVPYWAPRAFQGHNVYDLAAGASLDTVLKQMNTFTQNELNYLRDQTTKLVSDSKLRKHDWAVDWLQTANGEWYMTDMQTAGHSFMDYENIIFADENGRNTIHAFLKQQLDNMTKSFNQTSKFEKVIMKICHGKTSVDDTLEKYGYPTRNQIMALTAGNVGDVR